MPERRAISTCMLYLLLAVFLVTACGESAQESPSGTSPDGQDALEETLALRVDAILELADQRTEKTTITLENGDRVAARLPRKRDITFARAAITLNPKMHEATPGEIVASHSFDVLPAALLVDDEGTVVMAESERVVASPRGEATRTLAEGTASTLQWNAAGTELLASGPGLKKAIAWPDGKVAWDGSTRTELTGYLVYAPQGDDFWLLRDYVQFDASEDVRIYWKTWEVGRESGKPRELLHSPSFVSSLGTLPLAGIVWGHQIESHVLFPDPAPIWQIDPQLQSVGVDSLVKEEPGGWRIRITRPGEDVDLNPSVDRQGRLLFIRATRRIRGAEGGVLLGPSARVFLSDLHDATAERALTAEPTLDAALSPSGEWIAMLVIRDGKGVVLRARTEDLLARDLSDALEAREEFVTGAKALVEDLRLALATVDKAPPDEAGLYTPPTPALLETMKAALYRGLAHHAGIDLPDDGRALGMLDAYLDEADGLIPEEPATVAAIAAMYGSVLANEANADWMLETAREEMSYSMTQATDTEREFMRTLHAPFYVARERLAGRMPLRATAEELLRGTWMRITLAENFGPETLPTLVNRAAVECGATNEEEPTAALMERVVLEHPENDVMNRVAESWAIQNDVFGVELAASINRASSHPEVPENLTRAARALESGGYADLAMRLYAKAVELGPDNVDVLIAAAQGNINDGRLDEAEELLKRARAADRFKLGTESIEANEDLIRMLREPSQ
ncbi:MAG: hypothetical protein PWP23_1806 [Candidatus Sumerlaeota bacterium]|nr:hypothetical protein [Candidatus Sumerlaeota bacterium]